MKTHLVKFYQASQHDKKLVTIAGAPLRMAGFPVPPNQGDTLTLTLVYEFDGEPRHVPVTFRVNREPGKTLCTKEWPEEVPFPKCGDRKNGIPGEPTLCPVIHFTELPTEDRQEEEPASVGDAESPTTEEPRVEEEQSVAAGA